MFGVGVGNMVVVATIFNYRYGEETGNKEKKWPKNKMNNKHRCGFPFSGEWCLSLKQEGKFKSLTSF